MRRCYYFPHFTDKETDSERRKKPAWDHTAGLNSNLGLSDSKTLSSHTRPSRGESKANILPVLNLADDQFLGPGVCGLQPPVLWLLASSIVKEKSDAIHIFSTGAWKCVRFSLNPGSLWILPGYTLVCVLFLIHPAWSLGVLSIYRFRSLLSWRKFSCITCLVSAPAPGIFMVCLSSLFSSKIFPAHHLPNHYVDCNRDPPCWQFI